MTRGLEPKPWTNPDPLDHGSSFETLVCIEPDITLRYPNKLLICSYYILAWTSPLSSMPQNFCERVKAGKPRKKVLPEIQQQTKGAFIF